MTTILEGQHITKDFAHQAAHTRALDDITLQIEAGTFVAVMGPSGSGKSTLLFVLSGVDTPSSGKVRFKDTNYANLAEKDFSDLRRTRMGFVFQNPTMLRHLNLLDNILLPTFSGPRDGRADKVTSAKQLMQRTGIADLAHRAITEVSGGQLQRAGICRALINDPEILFADEPTGAMNSKTSAEIMDLFIEINQEGTTILLVTHDPKVAARAQRILFMKDGRLAHELLLGDYHPANLHSRTAKITAQMTALSV